MEIRKDHKGGLNLDKKTVKEKPLDIKPLKPLKTLDDSNSGGFICDMETGICGPIKEEKEKK